MPERELPSRPNLEQFRKQAKDLVKERARAAPDALARIRDYHPRLRGLPDLDIQNASFKLSDAQWIIAREHAFESWPKFARHLGTLQPEATGPRKLSGRIRIDEMELPAEITVPENATGIVLFTHASGSSRYHPRNHYIADVLQRAALGTVLTDLLTEEEELADVETEELQFDIRLLGRRIAAITDWIGEQQWLKDLRLGYFGSGTGAAAALFAAAEHPSLVQAVVSSGGRPDLAGPWLWKVQAPTLLIAGGKDTAALAFHHSAMAWFSRQTERHLEIIDGSTQRLEERTALDESVALASDWFSRFLNVGTRS